MFFDSKAVTSRMDAVTRRALSKFGAYVRSDAKRSIRKAAQGKKGWSKPSKPGTPPRSRIGTLKQHIYFAYEPTKRNVVIGPALLARARTDNLVMLEHGGQRQMTLPTYGNQKVTTRAKYPARPFMRPALERNMPMAASLYKDQLAKTG
jgi:hypothetical protein